MGSISDIKRYKKVMKRIAERKWSTLNQAMKLLEQKSKLEQKFRRNK